MKVRRRSCKQNSTPERGSQADTVADFLCLLLFTGLRKSEGLGLTWKDIDITGKTLTVADTKNHEPLTLPLSDFLHTLLTNRKTNATSEYVFPGNGKTGSLIEPRRQIAKVIETSGVSFTLHDLRRTFITVAESLDVPAYAIKRLVNHKMSDDVTAGYIVTDVERLRKPMQKISDYLVSALNVGGTKVVPLRKAVVPVR